MEDIGSSIAKEDYQSSMEDTGSSIGMLSDVEDIRSIIAMKGHPFTRKSELAKNIAASLRCPLLSYEDFLAELHPPLSPERQKEVFRIICRMAHNQIWERTSEAVVIDSPLSSAWHLEQLKEIAKSSFNVHVIIIECKPTNAYSWRLKFEEQMRWLGGSQIESFPWYKPKKWEDVEKAILINPADYDEKSVEDHELVSKLVVDPLFSDYFDMRLVEAVKYMMTRNKEDGSDVVYFHQWKQLVKYSDLDCSRDGHNIVSKSTAEERLAVDCAFCEKQVMMSDYYYYCKGCSLALHKDCAESSAPKGMESVSLYHVYGSPKQYACRTCEGKGEGFSDECGTCVVETHLRDRLHPTVIRHVDTEEHLLLTSEVLSEKFHKGSYCVGCGKDFAAPFGLRTWPRRSMYLCVICGLAYHYECLTFPPRVEHEHGLHHHHLSLKYTSEEAGGLLMQRV